jgi:membrane-associated protease RseP (regulator of RpoE activity)
MPNLIRMVRRLKLGKLTHVGWIRGVDVYVHWSVAAIAAIMLVGTIRRPLLTLVGLLSYLSILLIHECGHMIAAQRRKCRVWSIELYPIFGFCRFEEPWSRLDTCAIAWGGVVAQAVIGIPLVTWVVVFGYTRFEPINAVLALLGFYSLCVAAFNLIPAAPLDGATAWSLIPAWLARRKERQRNRAMRYRSRR